MLEAFGFFVRAGPFETDHVGEQLFREAMAEDEVLGDFLALLGKFNLPGAAYAKIAAAGHPFQSGGDGGRSYAQVFGEPGADGRVFFLNELPDGFEVVFLGDAGFFAAQGASRNAGDGWLIARAAWRR